MLYHESPRAGLEFDLRQPHPPRVVKDPYFCDYAQEVYDNPLVNVETLIVPIRDLRAAADSRRRNQQQFSALVPLWKKISSMLVGQPKLAPGGLWDQESFGKNQQERVLLHKFYNLLLLTAARQIPVILLQFPKFALDSTYTYQKLRPVLGDLPFSDFQEAFQQVVDPKLLKGS